MGVLKYVFRRPVVTAIGILMVMLAVVSLCITIGQVSAAAYTEQVLNDNFSSCALVTVKYQSSGNGENFQENFESWIEQMAQEHPELVEAVSNAGLASAYIPRLTIDNHTQHDYHILYATELTAWSLQPKPRGTPYSCAMLEIVLEEIGEPAPYTSANADAPWYVSVSLVGTVTAVVGLEEGYQDPTGFTAFITLKLPSVESLEEYGLVIGERYLIYGMDYYDRDWQRREWIEEDSRIESVTSLKPRSLTITVENKGIMPQVNYLTAEDGTQYPELITERSYVDENGETVECTMEEYAQRYTVPTMAHLTGTVEEFLTSEDGALWREALEQIEINCHGFPVIGVEKLSYIAGCVQEKLRIVEGRDFTQEELDSGAKVCIISQSLAEKNGISLGDTISLQYYLYDWSSPYQKYIHDGYGVNDPSAYFYTFTTDMTEEETYTVVGLYRYAEEWGYDGDNIYSITPNTIFAPKTSVTGSMDYAGETSFRTLVLKNGEILNFQQMVADAGYDGLFIYYDQGYSDIADSVTEYMATVGKAAKIGLAAFGVLMGLYLLLFPGQQRKEITIMRSLGAPRRTRGWRIFASSLCILIPGSVLGVAVSIGCWGQIEKMLQVSERIVPVEIDAVQLLLAAAAQLAAACAAVLVIALWMTRERKLGRRK